VQVLFGRATTHLLSPVVKLGIELIVDDELEGIEREKKIVGAPGGI
jgi:hypothetical protein